MKVSIPSLWLQVGRQPRVGVLSTGNELVEPSVRELAPGQIRDANRAMLAAAAQAGGAAVVDLGIAGDEAGEVVKIKPLLTFVFVMSMCWQHYGLDPPLLQRLEAVCCV